MNILITEKRKLWPKIKVCNVYDDDDDVFESIRQRNDWLDAAINNEDEFKLKTTMNARNRGEKHCIIKCSSAIRKLIMDEGDYLYTLFGKNKVFDKL